MIVAGRSQAGHARRGRNRPLEPSQHSKIVTYRLGDLDIRARNEVPKREDPVVGRVTLRPWIFAADRGEEIARKSSGESLKLITGTDQRSWEHLRLGFPSRPFFPLCPGLFLPSILGFVAFFPEHNAGLG